jgi:undecaprenyl-diphosphatase
VVIGLAIGDYIELLLGNAVVVAWALIIGGVAILIVEKLARPTDSGGVQNVSLKHSIGIGIVQCLAMVPGVSRSGATILGAMAMGVDRKTAAEFSFFLAVPTLSGATALQLYKHGASMEPGMTGWILLGSLVSFVVAVIVVKAFVAIIQRYGFAPFAWYRIVAGAAALVWLGMR